MEKKINAKFLKKFLELKASFYKEVEWNVKKYKKIKNILNKEVLINELDNSIKNTEFLINIQNYQRFDDYSWDWNIRIELTMDYREKYEPIFQERLNLISNVIKLEKEIINFKLKNFDNYYIFKFNEELKHKDRLRKITKKSNWNTQFIDLDDKIISKEKLKEILDLQYKLLNLEKWEKFNFSIKKINDISFEFEFLTFHNSNPFYWFLLDIYDFLLNFDNFKKDFYKDYPIVKKNTEKKVKHYDIIKNIQTNRIIEDNYKNYYLLNFPIIETLQNTREQKKIFKKLIKKDKINKYILEDLEWIDKNLNMYDSKRKENKILEWTFFKDEKDLNTYYLTKSNSKSLIKVMWYSLKDKYNLDDKKYNQIKKSNFQVNVTFSTY